VIIDAQVEEFEHGAWVADLSSLDAFSGSFDMAGSKWTGTKVTERVDFSRYYTRVVGGAGKLGVTIADKYYAGNVALSVAVQDVCREAGETFGGAAPGLFLNTYERIRCKASEALDNLAKVFDLIWWIDRSGAVQMQKARPPSPDATGTRIASDSDASILLVEPSGVVLGAGYESTDPVAKLKPIRHVRWHYTSQRITAQLYPLPFLFRSPVQTIYAALYSARVDKDNGDGTIDVIADSRFGITRVPLLSGVPGSKVQVRAGELVTLGFFGADPQKPFAVAMGQDTSAAKKVARVGDSIKIPAEQITGQVKDGMGNFVTCAGDLIGTITSGTDRLKVGD
jgi:hypothetical protein